MGAIGKILAHFERLGVTHVALGGHLSKPSLLDLKPDLKGMQAIVRLLRGKSWHDDALLRAVASVLVEEGYTVVSVADLTPGLLAPVVKQPTALGEVQPTAADLRDARLGVAVLERLGALDIGQAVVVAENTVLGVEAVEGTDALLARCAALRFKGVKQGGLLVKIVKPGQTEVADLPTIGPATLALLQQQEYRGVVVQGGATVLLEREALVTAANKHKLLLLVVPVGWA